MCFVSYFIVKISFENYRSLPPSYLEDQSDSDIENEDKSEGVFSCILIYPAGEELHVMLKDLRLRHNKNIFYFV